MNRFEYVSPRTFAEAVAVLAPKEGDVAKAGGVDLLDLMKEGLLAPRRLVNLLGVAGDDLRSIGHRPGDSLRIGALVRIADLAKDPTVRDRFAALAESAAHVATPQIRNMATVGGNLCQRPRCWYFRGIKFPCLRKGGDLCFAVDGLNRYHAILGGGPCYIVQASSIAPALLAFGARIRIVRAGGEREIPIERFYVPPDDDVERETVLAPGELIAEVIVPDPKGTTLSGFREYREKQSFDWALVAASVVLDVDGTMCRDARIVLGAVAPIPWRAAAAADALRGKTLSRETAGQAADAALRGADPMAENAYKIPLARSVVFRTILRAARRIVPGDPEA